jgi:hypothetical protein
MFIRKMGQAQKYRDEADDGISDGASGGGSGIDLNSPEVKALVQAEIDKTVLGLKKKNSDLIAQEKRFKEQLAQFDGVDPEKAKNVMKQLEQSEEMRLMAEGKLEEVVSRRVELRDKDWQNKYDSLANRVTEYESLVKQKDERLTELVIDGQIREAFVQLDYEPSALDLITMQGRKVFIMDESGKAVPRDEHGNLLFGKDAKTPLSAREWLESQAEKKTWLRKPSKGGGSQPNRGSGADISKMNATQRIAEGLRRSGFAT